MLPAVTVLGLFSIGSATSRNAQSLFITRFFGGLFGSAPISNVSAALGDMYEPKARGIAVTFYAVMVVGGTRSGQDFHNRLADFFSGPTLGPVVGSALTNNKALGWRATEYAEAIFVAIVVTGAFFAMPEMYSPVILKRKAKRVRKETGDERYWHPHEAERIRPNNVISKYFSRPIRMLVTEPVVTCVSCSAAVT